MSKNIRDLLIDELHDILSSEKQIVVALPSMVKAAESQDLKQAFQSHLKETKEQVKRLEQIFRLMKVTKKQKLCKATQGLIEECKQVIKENKTKSPTRDAALISKAQRIEHYEISAYGTMRTFAKELKLESVVSLLKETLAEEAGADKKLTKIAEGGLLSWGINHQANIGNEKKTSTLSIAKKKASRKPISRAKVVKRSVKAKKSSSPNKLKLRKKITHKLVASKH